MSGLFNGDELDFLRLYGVGVDRVTEAVLVSTRSAATTELDDKCTGRRTMVCLLERSRSCLEVRRLGSAGYVSTAERVNGDIVPGFIAASAKIRRENQSSS